MQAPERRRNRIAPATLRRVAMPRNPVPPGRGGRSSPTLERPPFHREHTPSRRSQEGWQVLAMFLALTVISLGIFELTMSASYSQIAGTRARARTDAALALGHRLSQMAPATSGGSVAPAGPVSGWADFVAVTSDDVTVLDPEKGVPLSGAVFRRQWRVRTDADGDTLFEVSVVALKSDLTPKSGPDAVTQHGRRALDR